MIRFVLILIPFAAAIAMIIGGYYAVQGARVIAAGQSGVGILFLGYGIMGLILGVTLWRAYRSYRVKARAQE